MRPRTTRSTLSTWKGRRPGIQHHAQAAVYLDDRRDGHGDPALLERDPGRRRDVLRQVDFTLLGEALERALARRRRICSGSWPIRAASWSDSPASACTAPRCSSLRLAVLLAGGRRDRGRRRHGPGHSDLHEGRHLPGDAGRPGHENIGAGQVLAAAYPVQFRLRATIETNAGPRRRAVVHTVRNGRPFRLPGNYRARASGSPWRHGRDHRATVASTLATSRRSDHGNLTTLRPALRGPAGDRGRPAAGQPGPHARAGADPPDARHALPARAEMVDRAVTWATLSRMASSRARRRRKPILIKPGGTFQQHAAGGGRHPPAPTGFRPRRAWALWC